MAIEPDILGDWNSLKHSLECGLTNSSLLSNHNKLCQKPFPEYCYYYQNLLSINITLLGMKTKPRLKLS